MINRSFRYRRDVCSGCKKTEYMVNLKYMLCGKCNKKRLEGEGDLGKLKRNADIARENKSFQMLRASRGKMIKDSKECTELGCFKKTYTKGLCAEHFWEKRIKAFGSKKKSLKIYGKKESEVKRELSSIKKEAKLKSFDSGSICEGCGKSKILDYSHILSVAQRKDLENDKENKNMLCRSCHNKWESNDVEVMMNLLCFWDNMKFILQKDKSRFYKIYFSFNDKLMFEECKMLEKIEDEERNG